MVELSARFMALDTGIERILYDGGPADVRLPDGDALAPGEGIVEVQLDAVLMQAGKDDEVLAFIRPTLGDRSMTLPMRFSAMLDTVLDRLEAVLQARPDDPAIAKAAAILRDEATLRDMINDYRKVLLRG